MKKQEAIEKIKNMETSNIISQIDEPQKVVIPQFVADWIDWCKRSHWDLQDLFSCLEDGGELDEWTHDENDDLIPEKVELLARAWLAYPNITVEKEKLYTVEIPNPNNEYSMNALIRLPSSGKIALVALHKPNTSYLKNKEYQLTESEIRKDFDWAWQWAKEVE